MVNYSCNFLNTFFRKSFNLNLKPTFLGKFSQHTLKRWIFKVWIVGVVMNNYNIPIFVTLNIKFNAICTKIKS